MAQEVLGSGSCPTFMTGEVIWLHLLSLLLLLPQEAEAAVSVESMAGRVVVAVDCLSLVLYSPRVGPWYNWYNLCMLTTRVPSSSEEEDSLRSSSMEAPYVGGGMSVAGPSSMRLRSSWLASSYQW